MIIHGVLTKAATAVVTGAVGVAAYEGLRKAIAKAPIREATVTTTALALRGVRRAEEGAESARLKVADVMAEARERIGAEVPPPAVANHTHTHEH